VPCDARPQLRAAQRLGIANFAAIKRGDRNFPDGARRRRPGSPISRWTMSCPSRSRRVAPASTSKAMKGATLDLRDKVTPGDDLPAMNGFFVICVAMFTGFWI